MKPDPRASQRNTIASHVSEKRSAKEQPSVNQRKPRTKSAPVSDSQEWERQGGKVEVIATQWEKPLAYPRPFFRKGATPIG